MAERPTGARPVASATVGMSATVDTAAFRTAAAPSAGTAAAVVKTSVGTSASVAALPRRPSMVSGSGQNGGGDGMRFAMAAEYWS